LRSGLLLVVFLSLLPIALVSVFQALNVLEYNRKLIGNRLATSALATVIRERDPLIIAERALRAASRNQAVRTGGPGCHEAFAESLADSPALVNFVRLDAQGRGTCSALPVPLGVSFASSDWFKRALRSDGYTISAPTNSPVSGKNVLFGALPMRSLDRSLSGLIVVSVEAQWLQKALDNEKLSQAAVVAIVGPDGQRRMVNSETSLPRFDVNLAAGEVVETAAPDGKKWLYAVAPLSGRELYVVYAQPSDTLMAVAVTQAKVALILPVLAMVLISLAIWIGADRLIVRWLAKLNLLAGQFAQGQYQNEPGSFKTAPREIVLLSTGLHAMGKAIATRDAALRTALEVKTALTSEVHHRVKNNLQIVSSLLTLQAGQITDKAAKEALTQARARIGALAQIHRLLYEEEHDGDFVDVPRLLADLCANLRSLHRHQLGIDLHCEATPQQLPASLAVPLSLFMVEVITNCYHHAFPGKRSGLITVRSAVENGRGLLTIRDNGIGFDSQAVTSSMGQQLMSAFAGQLGGSCDIAPAEGGGALVTLDYKLTSPSLEDQQS
jgi:two-component sensor histidine kinase